LINLITGETIEEELYAFDNKNLMEKRNVETEYPQEVKRLSAMLHAYMKTAPKWDGPSIP